MSPLTIHDLGPDLDASREALRPFKALFHTGQLRWTVVGTLCWATASTAYFCSAVLLPKALVDQGAVVTLSFAKSTPTISARQYETKKARELFSLTPEKATEARRRGAISYVTADQRERVAKAALTREKTKVVAEIKKLGASGERVPSNSPDKRRHWRFHPITPDAERRYREIRRRKLAGEHIPDGEWHWFIDYARRFKDPRYELLRGSPAAFGFSLVA